MRVAFVRGAQLNPWELQSYVPVARTCDFTAIGGTWQFYKEAMDAPGVRYKQGGAWGTSLYSWGIKWAVLWNRALSWTLGQSYGLRHFPELVAGADILHTAEIYSTLTYQALRVKRQTGCRLAVTAWENLPGMGETHPLRRRRKKQVIQHLDGVLAVTETTRRLLLEEGVPPERIAVIFPAVNVQRFQPGPRDPVLARQLGISEEDFVVLYIGRFVVEKGLHELLGAARTLLARHFPRRPRFLFVGAGPLRNEIEKFSRELGDGIVRADFVPYDQIPSLHNLADVFVLPSKAAPKWQEQFGYVLAESMACGKPIVTTRSGSIPDVVGNAALLVPPGDASELTEALGRLIHSREECDRLSDLARKRALQSFSLEVVTPQLERFYRQIAKGLPVNPSPEGS